jgi:hypothetical protein
LTQAPRRRHGALKGDLLELLVHASAPLSARELRSRLSAPTPALASVLTVLERMRRAGEIERIEAPDDELRFAIAREDAAAVVHGMIDSLLRSADRTGALMSFAGSLDESDAAVLRRALGADDRKRA